MLRLGIVDFDSSHSIEFTQRFNHVGVDADQWVDGARVELGWPGDSQMAPERIAGFTQQVARCGVRLVDSPAEMLGQIDGVLVLSLCGSAHLERVRPFLETGVPSYVDKPFACSYADALEMVRLAQKHETVLFNSSALPYAEEIERFRSQQADHGTLHGVVSCGPAGRAAGNPGLFHYGVHATSILFALMGQGCDRVVTTYSVDAEVVTGIWRDGRIGTVRGNRRGSTAYSFLAFCERGVIHQPVSSRYAYRNLCRKIVESFSRRKADVPIALPLEITRFVLASLESESRQGEPIELDSIHP
ncbi:MAG: Gfo/Idh/MocA family oxidoreductase [Planctomycetaceae bacterium]